MLGYVNFPAPRKRKCSDCGTRELVHAYHKSDPSLPLCQTCTAKWSLLEKYLTLNKMEA